MSEFFTQIEVANKEGLEAAFQIIHSALKRHGEGQVGLSFPEWCTKGLGRRLLLISSDTERLDAVTQYIRLSHPITEVQSVPADAERRIFCRSRRHQRYTHFRRHGDPEGRKRATEKLNQIEILPTIRIESSSNRQSFAIAIDNKSPGQATDQSTFNSYGLSSGRTVPVF